MFFSDDFNHIDEIIDEEFDTDSEIQGFDEEGNEVIKNGQ